MKFTFRDLTAVDLRSCSLGELLAHIEADFIIEDAGKVLYEERSFPVAELAFELNTWLVEPSEDERFRR